MQRMRMLLVTGIVLAVSFGVFGQIGVSQEVVLKVGTNAEYPPFEFKEKDEFKGIDMDLARLIASKMGAKVEINNMEFDSLIPSLAAKKIDLAMAAMTITDARKQQVDFSIPYYSANQAIIVSAKAPIAIKSVDDIAKYTVGSQNGTTGQVYMDENFVKPGKMKKDKFRKYPTNIEAITDLLNGNLDLVIIDDSAANGYSKLKPVKVVFTIETGENYGIAFPKNSPHLSKVNAALEQILKSEEWTELLKKYL